MLYIASNLLPESESWASVLEVVAVRVVALTVTPEFNAANVIFGLGVCLVVVLALAFAKL